MGTEVLLWLYVLCLWSDHSEFMGRFYGFNLWNVPVFLSLSLRVDIFKFSIALFTSNLSFLRSIS